MDWRASHSDSAKNRISLHRNRGRSCDPSWDRPWNSTDVRIATEARPRSTSHFNFHGDVHRGKGSNSEAARTPSLSYESAEFSHEVATCSAPFIPSLPLLRRISVVFSVPTPPIKELRTNFSFSPLHAIFFLTKDKKKRLKDITMEEFFFLVTR